MTTPQIGFRSAFVLAAAVAVLAGAAPAVAMGDSIAGVGSATPAVASAHPATARVVVRPVTADGHAVAGFAVDREPQGVIDCRYPEPSPGAVSKNIEFCSPSAAYAIACWKSARRHHALCMRDPRRPKLVEAPLSGRFAPTPPARHADRAPLFMVLTDGTKCSIRSGGAWGPLDGHPKLFGTYSCSRHGVIWARSKTAHEGVDESAASWTVRTAQFGHGHLVTRHVQRAYFVGTASTR